MLKPIWRWTKRLLLFLLIVIVVGLVWPDDIQMPVEGATDADFNKNTFWFYPWGKSGTHKGVDIFADRHTPVYSASKGLVIYTGQYKYGGNVVIILGPKWRFHYYAHLEEIKAVPFTRVNHNSLIGTVGDSGNAKGKATHLHYSIYTFIPQFANWGAEHEPYKKLFYVDPIPYIKEN